MGRGGRFGALATLVALACATVSAAQDGREKRPAVDPYTHGDERALERAGYISLGPFLIADGHTTTAVDEALGGAPILWIETAHFRLGCSLDAYSVPKDQDERRKLREELGRLGEKVPRVKSRSLKLDPWLRAHLYAQRLEDLYASFCSTLAVVPPDASDAPEAPRVGTPGKSVVLVFQRESSLSRYTGTFCSGQRGDAYTEYFQGTGTFLFGISNEAIDASDTDLHYGLVFGVSQNLTCSINGFTHVPPRWWTLGLARWFARRVTPKVQLYIGKAGDALPPDELADWEALVLGRVRANYYPDWASTFALKDTEGADFGDHIVLWSRVDYLLAQEDAVLKALVNELHEPVPAMEDRDAFLANRFDRAVMEATSKSLEGLDADWSRWVQEAYDPKRRKKRK